MLKKVFKKGISLFLILSLSVPCGLCSFAFSNTLKNETFALRNGLNRHNVETTASSGAIGPQNINVATIDTRDTNNYSVDYVSANGSKKKTSTLTSNFAKNNGKDLTPLVSVNGTMWTMCRDNVWNPSDLLRDGSKHIQVPRGFTAQNGEILYTRERENEYTNPNGTYDDIPSYCINKDGTAYITRPEVKFSIKSEGKTITTDNLNRLPGKNMLVMYSDNGMANNYCKDDSYEVLIKCNDTNYKVTPGGKIEGKIVSIHAQNSGNKYPVTNKKGYIVLCARGDKINSLKMLQKNKSVTITNTISVVGNSYSGGTIHHADLATKGIKTAIPGENSIYFSGVNSSLKLNQNNALPNGKVTTKKNETGDLVSSIGGKLGVGGFVAKTVLGVTQDGKTVVLTLDKTKNKKWRGVTVQRDDEFNALAEEYNLKECLSLDGGGSTTMVAINQTNNGYSVVNCVSDGINEEDYKSTGVERPVIDCFTISLKDQGHKENLRGDYLIASRLDAK